MYALGCLTALCRPRLKTHVDAHCPVLDLLSNPTPLSVELRTEPVAEIAAA